jgi:MFS family permease
MGLGLCALSHNLIQLVLLRALQAIGASMTVATGYAIITAAFPANERGRAMGIMGAVTGIGLLTGPAAGGFLLDLLGWRSIFYFSLSVGASPVRNGCGFTSCLPDCGFQDAIFAIFFTAVAGLVASLFRGRK